MSNDTSQRYRGDQGKSYHQTKRSIPPQAYDWIARVRSEKIQPHVRPTDRVLEYGVGLGWNLAALDCAYRAGYDIGEFLEEPVGKHGIEFVHRTDALTKESFDVVLCHHVLEHTLSPAAVLSEVRQLLRPQGKLLLYVPYEKERRYRTFNASEPNHHLYSWNVQTLGNLVQECGMSVQQGSIEMFSYDRFSSVWAVRLGVGERGYRLIRRLVHAAYPCLEVRVVAVRE